MPDGMNTPVKFSPEPKFSPVSVSLSPVVRIQGNLTGTVRQIRDTVADLYNHIHKWNNSFLKGVNVLQDIIDLKLLTVARLDNTNDDDNLYPEGLQKLCDDFDIIFNDLVHTVNSMQSVVRFFRGINKLEESKRTDFEPLFLTWPTNKFEKEASIIANAYDKELSIKKYVKENICHSVSKDSLLVCLPLWVQQCHIGSDIDFRLEAMLKETGHR